MVKAWYGTSGSDYFSYTGNDSLLAYGNQGNDFIVGNALNDYIRGNSGNDTLYGGNGNDQLFGDDGNDFLYGGSGADSLDGSIGSDVLYGESGSDILSGGTGNDWLDGGSESDILKGFSSYATNAAEYDTLIGGAGFDTFVLGNSGGQGYLGSGFAIINDYTPFQDFVQLKGVAADYSLFAGFYDSGSAPDIFIATSSGDVLGILLNTSSFALNSSYANFV